MDAMIFELVSLQVSTYLDIFIRGKEWDKKKKEECMKDRTYHILRCRDTGVGSG